MKDAVLYIHGKGGCAAECEHYRPLFPGYEVIGLDYHTFSPWETGEEIRAATKELNTEYESIILIANSIGAYFSVCAGIDHLISKAYFISPIVDMKKLITDMMQWANITEAELKYKGTIHTAFGEDLSWEYLRYVREHPVGWKVPTSILYGSCDNLTSFETISDFVKKHGATLTVMESGEHWFHTEEQMRFLDNWIRSCEGGDLCSHCQSNHIISCDSQKTECHPSERPFVCWKILDCEGTAADAPRWRDRGRHPLAGRLSANVSKRTDLGGRCFCDHAPHV